MCCRRAALAVGACVIWSAGALLAEAPTAVSPGSPTAVTLEARCPTFSWSGVDKAVVQELAVYRLDAEGDRMVAVLLRRLPGAAASWTPALTECFAPGERYAWSVRAVDRRGQGRWSTPNLFSVSAGPSAQELRRAVAVVEEYLASDRQDAASAVNRGGEAAATTNDLRSAEVRPGLRGPGMNTVIGNTSVTSGTLEGDLVCTDCVAGTEIQDFSITADDIAAATITAAEIAFDTLTGSEIAPDAIGSSELADDAVASAHIVDGTITADDLGTDSVGPSEIQGRAVGGAELAGLTGVNVECNGNCRGVTLQNACDASGTGKRPIAVSCDQVKDFPTTRRCGSGFCSFIPFVGTADLDAFCDDVFGWDAVVLCLQN